MPKPHLNPLPKLDLPWISPGPLSTTPRVLFVLQPVGVWWFLGCSDLAATACNVRVYVSACNCNVRVSVVFWGVNDLAFVAEALGLSRTGSLGSVLVLGYIFYFVSFKCMLCR